MLEDTSNFTLEEYIPISEYVSFLFFYVGYNFFPLGIGI